MEENRISVKVYTSCLVSGDVVSGTVSLDVFRPFLAKGVCVLFYGYEKTKFSAVVHPQSSPSSPQQQQAEEAPAPVPPPAAVAPPSPLQAERKQFGAVRELFRKVEKLHALEGVYQCGSRTFDFRFALPQALPGTFEHSGPGWSAKVAYKVIAFVDDGALGAAAAAGLRSVARLIVNERFDSAPAVPRVADKRDGSQAFKGGIKVKSRLNRAVFFPGERLLVRTVANSMGKKSTRKSVVTVLHEIVLRAPLSSEAVQQKQQQQQQMMMMVDTSREPPLPPPPHQVQQQPLQQQQAEFKEVTIRTEMFRFEMQAFPPCFYGERWAAFDLPTAPRPTMPPSSTTGTHIRSTYTVNVLCDIAQGVDISLSLPFIVLAPQAPVSPGRSPLEPVPPDVSFRHPWQPDTESPVCNSCGNKFTLWLRRHHCRHCGMVSFSHTIFLSLRTIADMGRGNNPNSSSAMRARARGLRSRI